MITIEKDKTYWCSVIADYLASGMNQAAYCARHNIVYSTFKRWRYSLKHEFPIPKKSIAKSKHVNQQSTFAPVTIIPEQSPHIQKSSSASSSKLPSMQLHLNKQITLELPAGLDKQMLSTLFSALGISAC